MKYVWIINLKDVRGRWILPTNNAAHRTFREAKRNIAKRKEVNPTFDYRISKYQKF